VPGWLRLYPSSYNGLISKIEIDKNVQWFDALRSEHIYKKIELVGSSPNGIEDAANNAITRAGKTMRNMKWFKVTEVRGHLENNKVADWQVTVKVGFTLDT